MPRKTPTKAQKPRKVAKASTHPSRFPAPPKGLPATVRTAFGRIWEEHAERLGPGDVGAVAELAALRTRARTMAKRLDREGPTIKGASGSKKANPAIAALAALTRRERRLVSDLGLTRPNFGTARQIHVGKQREDVARTIDRTFAGPGGDLLAGHDEWAAEKKAPGQISQTALRMVRAWSGR
ncbi:hypothetical protein DSM104443_01159 [Usitatibacter rugosus]|uniref:Uncharacterized protein n=1 Tax=Usitatibacter rugosus TaxID=2732067 RepID=A0A6M4GSN5_9PROT|nr:P27 family phage terminase small subunit [Usitatibacter rugosus]QJR10106.1 hypothetical protein DSM104443_01159 [Usitatibacter rugosus]